MSKIVVLSTIYLGTASANGLCARNIVTALQNKGHDVHVICFEDVALPSENTHTIPKLKQPSQNTIWRIIRKINVGIKLIFRLGAPISDKELEENYYKKLCEINAFSKIDAVIAMYFPIESVKAVCKFKKENPQTKAILFELDSAGDGVADSGRNALESNHYETWLRKVYKTIDTTLVMQSHKAYWEKNFGLCYENKLKITDLPSLLENKDISSSESEIAYMIYAGMIERRYRAPSYLLQLLKELDKTMDFKFDFFSKGDCEEQIAETAKTVKGIFQRGYVPQEELEKSIQKADFLINIGNSVSRSVPSKLITYLSYGKPIIHFSSQKNDVCNEYLKKYPLALVVDQTKPVEESCIELIAFIKKYKGKTLGFETVRKVFYMNDPAYSADLICDVIE